THVFTALAVNDDNTTLRWNVMTVPGGTTITKPASKKAEKGAKVVEPVAAPASTPAEALDRVTIPPEALQEISVLISAGASLIISDQGLSGETGKGTDFIVLV